MSSSVLRMRRKPLSDWGIFALVAVLLCFGALNIAERATWYQLEDGVLWEERPEGVTAAAVASGSPAVSAGLRPGDILIALNGAPVETPDTVRRALQNFTDDTRLTYTVIRLGRQEMANVRLAPVPAGNRTLYFILAAIGVFTLLIGAGVRLRRRSDPSTLHFFWLCLAVFGTFTFSYSGKFDRLDWFFYWADVPAMLLLGPLFLHFTLVFPDRPAAWVKGPGRRILPLLYLPAVLLGATRIVAVGRLPLNTSSYVAVLSFLDQVEPLYLSAYMIAGLIVQVRMLGWIRSLTARRQLRWIVWGTALGAGPFALGYALPYALGFRVSLPMQLSVIPLSLVPLAFASAIIRYRLMDVEVIVKRSLGFVTAVAAILIIYATLLRLAGVLFFEDAEGHHAVIATLATLVVVLLASPVKNAIQTALDRAFYRDRYDYRRALVGFARDLNSDLDLDRLSERLVARVRETFGVDRMALLLLNEASGDYEVIRSEGFAEGPERPEREAVSVPTLDRGSQIAATLAAGRSLSLDESRLPGAFPQEELASWRVSGVHSLVPCVSKGGTIAVLALGQRSHGELLSSEDTALLLAVGSHVATALENGRLYRQLQLKAVELQRLQQFNENIVESLEDGLIVLDLDGRVVRWNRALEKIYGIPPAEATGRSLDDLFDGPFVQALRSAQQDAPGGASLYRLPLAGRSGKAGERFRVNVAIAPLRAPATGGEPPPDQKSAARGDGTPPFDELRASRACRGTQAKRDTGGQGPPDQKSVVGSIVIIEDVTERVQLEEQLQISDKMASIGLLAAGVAHEVNTPLTGISSFTQMLLNQAPPDDPKTRLLEKIEQQTFRAARIVNGLLNLSRSSGQNPEERVPVDINAVVNDVLALFEPQLVAGKIKVRRDLCSSPALVPGVEHKLQQVFLNLFLNARDAMPKGGWLSVATRIEGGQAIAEISDTGPGIPNEHLARIYDPFFTTKLIGKGTGLGLSITYGIVREHEGTISCQSAVGQGTKFTVSLPHTAGPAARAGAVRS